MATSNAERPIRLDHVAHAVGDWREIWTRYATDLGAVWVDGGQGRGFAPAQVRFANGARIEMLMPWAVEANDFLARFLAHSGPGPHHLTFKVRDLGVALGEASQAGFAPVGVDVSDPNWMEAFLHPKQATGIVVQLAQSSIDPEGSGDWQTQPPDDFPRERRLRTNGSGPVRPATLDWVVHAVADRDLARSLFVDLLHGSVLDEHAEGPVGWTAVSWGGPLGVRLLWPTAGATGSRTGPRDAQVVDGAGNALDQWIAHRAGRLHHLELVVEDPDSVPDAVPTREPLDLVGARRASGWKVPGRANHGLPLVIVAAEDTP